MAALLLAWKEEHPFLKEAPSQALQQRLMDLDKALHEALDPRNPKRFPKFKRKHTCRESFRYPQGFAFKKNRVYLPKFGWVRFYKAASYPADPKTSLYSRKAPIGSFPCRRSWKLLIRCIRPRQQSVSTSASKD
jgi:putative transposase